MAILTRQGKPNPKTEGPFATCVVVKKDNKVIASGRVAFMTFKSAILVGGNGQARKVPVGDAVVEIVSELPPDVVVMPVIEKGAKSEV